MRISEGESLANGAEGEQVEELQRRLLHLGYYQGQIDGYFGDTTQAAVTEYQRNLGQPEDGTIEAETWDRLEAEVQSTGYDQSSAEPEPQQELRPGQLSQDGEWRWTGTDWVSARDDAQPAAIEVGQLSEDGQWRWDGTDWVSANGNEAHPADTQDAAQDTQAQAEAKPWTREINEEIDSPDTEAAELPVLDGSA